MSANGSKKHPHNKKADKTIFYTHSIKKYNKNSKLKLELSSKYLNPFLLHRQESTARARARAHTTINLLNRFTTSDSQTTIAAVYEQEHLEQFHKHQYFCKVTLAQQHQDCLKSNLTWQETVTWLEFEL